MGEVSRVSLWRAGGTSQRRGGGAPREGGGQQPPPRTDPPLACRQSRPWRIRRCAPQGAAVSAYDDDDVVRRGVGLPPIK